jgi:hypothetical protein
MKGLAAIVAALIGAMIGLFLAALVGCFMAAIFNSTVLAVIAFLLSIAAAMYGGYRGAKMVLDTDHDTIYRSTRKKD